MSRRPDHYASMRTLQQSADGMAFVTMLEAQREDEVQKLMYASPTQVHTVQGRVQVLDELLQDFHHSIELGKRGS